MRRDLLEYLTCPECPEEPDLTISSDAVADGDEVLSGALECSHCGIKYPLSNGIPRFVSDDDDYCGNFGFQWQMWRTLQIDRLSNHTLSEDRFFNDSRWDRGWLQDKIILDAGCGAGRFADIAAKYGATVIAVDLSNAIDACRETTSVHGGRVHCLQASLFELPLRRGNFDGVYCMGVIQHTPDPAAVMAGLPAFLKPGGQLAYNFYEEDLWRRLQVVKYSLRLFTRGFSVPANLRVARILVAMFFPLTQFFAKIPKVRIINHFIPIASVHDGQLTVEQQRAWTLLDTFDWYGARFELRQNHMRVADILREAELEHVSSEPGLAWASKPGA